MARRQRKWQFTVDKSCSRSDVLNACEFRSCKLVMRQDSNKFHLRRPRNHRTQFARVSLLSHESRDPEIQDDIRLHRVGHVKTEKRRFMWWNFFSLAHMMSLALCTFASTFYLFSLFNNFATRRYKNSLRSAITVCQSFRCVEAIWIKKFALAATHWKASRWRKTNFGWIIDEDLSED